MNSAILSVRVYAIKCNKAYDGQNIKVNVCAYLYESVYTYCESISNFVNNSTVNHFTIYGCDQT